MAINKRGDKYVLDWWSNGRRFRKHFDTKREADAYKTRIKNKKLDGIYIAPDKVPLFRDAAATWLVTRSNRAPATFQNLTNRVRRHLLTAFGEKRLDQITPKMIETWRTNLSTTGVTSRWRRPMKPRVISNLVSTLSQILDSAVRERQLANNPAKLIERQYDGSPNNADAEVTGVKPDTILNSDEIRRLIEAASPRLPRTLFTLAAVTGARSGELLGLKWSDVHFDGAPRICIRRGLSWARRLGGAKPEPFLRTPKTNQKYLKFPRARLSGR